MIRAVGFDLDDTLAVPERSRTRLLAEALDAGGAPELTDVIDRVAYLDAHANHRTADSRVPVFAELLGPHDAEADPAEVAAAYREAVTTALVPVPDAPELVTALRDAYRVGLLTNGPVRAQSAKLDYLDWWDAFDAVRISGDLPAGKPDERAFAALLDALEAEPKETAFVGDHPVEDVRGAAAAGLRTVHVLGEGDEPALEADASVARDRLARDLPGILREL
ncbi:HAD family hydrolase [Halobaculum gomorrense]|uniref:Putative hydrolase of the HAD superfamily n=1 Tax=Halobaculum gomorrense TaxID=43928 RepID=A0A1M5KSX4_9EURY|nr:HAD family hydrolase [Halobaculum gomorrense]SHG55263.1 putative hydrolase of the HAD superfamily [Halobaculum gomorrense]